MVENSVNVIRYTHAHLGTQKRNTCVFILGAGGAISSSSLIARLAAYLAEIFYDTTGLLVGPGTGNMNSLMPSNNHDYGGFGGYRGSSSSARSRSSSGPNGRNGASGSSSGQGDEVSAWWRLLDAAEECRLALSDNLNATVYLPELVDYCPLGPGVYLVLIRL